MCPLATMLQLECFSLALKLKPGIYEVAKRSQCYKKWEEKVRCDELVRSHDDALKVSSVVRMI